MTAVEFLDKLEQQGLLDAKLVATLRQQVAQSRKGVSAQKIAKLLIDKGHLTAFQAKKLMDDGARAKAQAAPQARKSAAPATAPAVIEAEGLDLLDEGDDLGLDLVDEEAAEPAPAGLTPIDDNGLDLLPDDPLEETPPPKTATVPKKPVKGQTTPAAKDPLAPLTPVDDGGGLTPLDSGLGLTPAGGSPSVSSILSGGDTGLTAIDPLPADASAPLTADPMSADPMSADPMAAPASKPSTTKIGAKPPKIKNQSQWDTPLMLLGGGGLIGLVIAGFVLYRLIFSVNAAELFQAGTDAYRAQSYTQAISIYEEFLSTFPEDPSAGPAWVLIRTAQLRQVVEGKNWDSALKTAKSVLQEIDEAIASARPPAPELPSAFNEHGRPELASLLPDIAAGFAVQAKTARTMEDAGKLVALAEDAMTLVNNPAYIPTTLRETVEARIDAIQEDIGIARRNINRDKARDEALAAIDAALSKSDTSAAFEVRKALIKTYPELENHPRLIEAVRRTTEKERELVTLSESPRAALTDDKPADGVKVVAAAVNGDPAPGVPGSVVAFLARGAVYGLDATSGQVRWRRFVGHETTVHPQRVSQETAAGVVLLDGQSHELSRIAADTGQLQWRLPLEAAASAPVAAAERMFVAAESGLLLEVDTETGASNRQVKFPQPLRSRPAVDEARGLLIQVGEHSNLYVLSAETLDCKLVHYLGHRAGTIVMPPVLSRGQMLIAENAGADYCLIHVLPTTDELDKFKPSQAPFRLKGNVVTPPFVYERRVVLTTDLGGIYLFEIDSVNKKQPVTIVAQTLPAGREAVASYALADAGQLWVASNNLTRYEIQAARGELVRQEIRNDAGVYAAPLQKIGNVLFHARRRPNSEGLVITAAAADTLRPYWSTEVGAPMVSLVPQPGAGVAAMSVQGALFPVTRQSIEQGVLGSPQRAGGLEADAAFEPPLTLPDGRLAFPGVERKNRILVLDPAAAAPPKVIELHAPEGRATAAPVAFQGGLLTPTTAGLVYLSDPNTGESLALPLRPPMAPGEELVWQAPAVSANGEEFVIASDQKKVYRVALRQQPKPHLAALTTRDLDGVIVSRLARAGETIYGVERLPQGDSLLTLELPSLAFRKIPLDGRLAWGPHEVDGAVLLATHQSLLRLDGDAQPRWARPLDYGPPVAPPWVAGGEYLFASVGGTVWALNAETGQEASKTVLGEPLAAGPALLGQQMLLGGSDGVLHFLPHVGSPLRE